MKTEPVAVAAAVRAVLLAVAAFGFDLTGEQVAAAAIAVEAVLTLFVRQQVIPVAGVEWINEDDIEFVDAVSTYGFQPADPNDEG